MLRVIVPVGTPRDDLGARRPARLIQPLRQIVHQRRFLVTRGRAPQLGIEAGKADPAGGSLGVQIANERIDDAADAPQAADRVSHLLGGRRSGSQTAIQIGELVDAALEVDRIEPASLDQPLHQLGLDLQGVAPAVVGFLAEHHHGLAADIADQAVQLNGGLGVQAASEGPLVNRMIARYSTRCSESEPNRNRYPGHA